MKTAVLHREGSLHRFAVAAEDGELERAAVDKESRTATFVVATERAVSFWFGAEVLRMSGVDLKRFKKNPVVVDTHNTWSIRSILGTAKVRVEGKQLLADITFDATPEGEAAWQRVMSGSLRATSIGYMPDRERTKQLREGETDGKGDSLVTGPAFIVKGWELREITMCPVPADEDALRRSFYTPARPEESPVKKPKMSYSELPVDDDADEGGERAAPVVERTKEDLDAERDARVAENRAKQRAAIAAEIRSITPSDMKDVGEGLVLEGLDVEAARKRLLEERAKRSKPLGTTEPAPIPTTTPAKTNDADEIRSLVTKATAKA